MFLTVENSGFKDSAVEGLVNEGKNHYSLKDAWLGLLKSTLTVLFRKQFMHAVVKRLNTTQRFY